MTGNDQTVFSTTEMAIIKAVRALRDSPLLAAIKAAFAAGESRAFEFNGRKLFVEPDAPFAGLTWMAENAFHLGAEAFESDEALLKTLLHELYRLDHSHVRRQQGVDLRTASRETRAAFAFSERAWKALDES